MRNEFWIIGGVIGLVLTAGIGASAYKYKYRSQETIQVTGSAEQQFSADLVVWNSSYSREGTTLSEAYTQLKSDADQVRAYLSSQKIKPEELVFSAISTTPVRESITNAEGQFVGEKFVGYRLTQNVTLKSKDINLVEKISREATDLIEKGINLNSEPPAYYYTKLSELKINLLAKATADGYLRAKTIADNSDASLGNLRRANMGVFQITAQYSNESYTYMGAYNTSDRNKTAQITVKMDFAAE